MCLWATANSQALRPVPEVSGRLVSAARDFADDVNAGDEEEPAQASVVPALEALPALQSAAASVC